MQLALIINSIVCVVGVIVGVLFAGASIISIANMTVPWSGALLVAAILVPVAFVVSGIGAWLADGLGAPPKSRSALSRCPGSIAWSLSSPC